MALVALTVLAPAAAASFTVPAQAQEYREDPFRPTTTRDEEKRLQEDEKVRKALRDMIPEIRAKVVEDMDAQRAANAEAMKRAIIESLKSDPAFAQRASLTGAPSAAEVAALGQGASMSAPAVQMEQTPLPDDAQFIACLNGKELYKDVKRHTRFTRDLPKGVPSKCAVDILPAMSPRRPDVVAAAGQALANGAAAVAGGLPAVPPPGVAQPMPMPGPPGMPVQQPNAVAVPRPVLPAGAPGRPVVPPPVAQPMVQPMPGRQLPPQPMPVGARPGLPPQPQPVVAPSRPAVPPPPGGVPGAAPAPAPAAGGASQAAPAGPLDMSVGYRYPRPIGN